MTQTGLSLGTPQYMSPEQAMGERTIDARSDIYALGAVTYEMLVGEPPFTGPTVQAIVARVMTEEPRPLHTQRKAIPAHVEDAVLRALEKLPADRWSSAQEFADALGARRLALRRAPAPPRRARVAARPPARRGTRELRDPIVLGLLGIALASVGLAGWERLDVKPESTSVVRFTIPAPQDASSNSLGLNTLAISRDGRTLVYIGQGDARRPVLMLRALNDITPHPLPGTEDANNPIFSPDGRWVAFVRGNQLFKIAVDGDRPQLLAPLPGTFNGMSWSSTGVIVVSGNVAMYVVPDVGGQARQLGKPDRRAGEVDQDAPFVLDDDGIYLYASTRSSAISTSQAGDRVARDRRADRVRRPRRQPLGVVDGVLTYVAAGGVIMGVPIDVEGRKLTGKPVQLVSDVSVNPTTGLARVSLSRDGTLFYQTGTQSSQVVMAGGDGSSRVLLAEPREYAFPRLSPDGRRLAVAIGGSDRRDIWIYDLGSQTATRLTNEGTTNDRPEWTPDGKRVLYRTDRRDRSGIWWRPVDLSADATALIEGPTIDVFEGVISPDMRNVVYQLDTIGADVLYRSVSGDTTQHVVSNSASIETMPRLSPDGRWVAFITDESGRNEVVVQPFPGPGGRVQISSGGGSEPVWSRDGKRLFYRGDGHLMAATLDLCAVVQRDQARHPVHGRLPVRRQSARELRCHGRRHALRVSQSRARGEHDRRDELEGGGADADEGTRGGVAAIRSRERGLVAAPLIAPLSDAPSARRELADATCRRRVGLTHGRRHVRLEHLDREAEGATFTRLQRADPDDVATDFFALVVRDRYDRRILPRLASTRVADRTVHPERSHGRSDGDVARDLEVLAARRADARALEDHRPAMRAGARCPRRRACGDAHETWRFPSVSVLEWDSSPHPNSARPRMRDPAATVSVPALRSPFRTPVASSSTFFALSMLPSTSPAIATASARMLPVSLAPCSIVRSPSM